MQETTSRVGRVVRIGATLVVGLLTAALVPAIAGTANADPTSVEFIAKNQSCGALGFLHEVKLNGVPANGGYAVTVDGVPGTITISNSASTSFTWASTIPVSAVFVKAGDGGNLFTYVPPDLGPEDVYSPDNGGGNQAQISHVSFCFGDADVSYEVLTIEKSAIPGYGRDFDWTILKTASPTIPVTTAANTFTFDYTVQVTKGEAQDTGHHVAGQITVFNPNLVPVSITEIGDAIENDPLAATCVLDFNGADVGLGSAPTSIDANTAIVVDYLCTFADGAAAVATNSNTATVGWIDPASGNTLNAQAIQPYVWGGPDTVTDDSVDVDDQFPGLPLTELGTISESTPFTYPREVTVPASGCATYTNTATVHETEGDSTSSASVTVCRKTNDGFTRGYWTNKNGAAWIKANQATVTAILATYPNALAGVGSSANAIATIINGSNSSGDAFTQFRAQFLATALSVGKTPSLGGQFITGPDGSCRSINEWLAYGDANLATLKLVKADLIAMKSLYDSVNNNAAPSCIP